MNKIKRMIASLSVAAILSSLVVTSTALAQYYDDVLPSQYWFSATEWLGDIGALDTSKTMNYPDREITRAEFAKVTLVAAGYTIETATEAPFLDVPMGEWYTDFIYTASMNNVVTGYKNADGSMTGNFGPMDNVRRAEAAAIVNRAFGFTLLTEAEITQLQADTGVTFGDVPMSAWYYADVYTSFDNSIVTGPNFGADGVFLPDNFILRGDAWVMICRAAGEIDNCTAGPQPTIGVNFSGNDTPGVVNQVPNRAQSIPFLDFDMEATEGEGTLRSLVFQRSGVSEASDFDEFYIVDAATGLRLNNSGRSINSETNQITFSNLNVPVNGMTNLMLVGSISDTAEAGDQGIFTLIEAGFDATEQSVTGIPVTGSTFEVGSQQAAEFELITLGTLPEVTLGQTGAELANFEIDGVTGDDLVVKRFLFENEGSADTEGVYNWMLEVNSNMYPCNAQGDLVACNITDNVVILEGDSEVFTLFGDIGSGIENGDTIQMEIDNDTDILAESKNLGFGANVTNTFPFQFQEVDVDAGVVSFTFSNSPQTGDIAVDSNNESLFDFAVVSETPITIDDLQIQVEGLSGDELCEDPGDTDPVLTSIKVIDSDSGSTVTDTQEISCGGANPQTLTFSDIIDVPAVGSDSNVRNFSVVANVEDVSQATEVQVTLLVGSSVMQIEDAQNNTVPAADIVPSTDLEGNVLTIITEGLTVKASNNPLAQTYVSGEDDVAFGGFVFQASDARPLTVTDVDVVAYYSEADTTPDSGSGDLLTVLDYLQSPTLYVGGVPVSTAENFDANGVINFDNLDITVPAGGTVTAVVRGNISNNAPETAPDYFRLAIDDPSTDVQAETADQGTTVDVNPVATEIQSRVMIVQDAGTLTVSSGSNSPSPAILVGGGTEFVHELRFDALRENFELDDMIIEVYDDNATIFADNVEAISLYQGDTLIAGPTAVVLNPGGTTADLFGAKFTNLNLNVPKDGNIKLEVHTVLSTVDQGAESGTGVQVRVPDNDDQAGSQEFQAFGSGSGITLDSNNLVLGSGLDSQVHIFRDSVPVFSTVAQSDNGDLANGGPYSYEFTVEATGNSAISLGEIALDVNATGAVTIGNATLRRGANDITNLVEITTGGTDFTNSFETPGQVIVDFSNAQTRFEEVDAGQEVTYELQFFVQGSVDGDSLNINWPKEASPATDDDIATLSGTSNVVWSDQAGDSGTGVHSATSDDYINGYLLNLFPGAGYSYTDPT